MKSVNRYVDKGLPVCRYRGATESLQNNCDKNKKKKKKGEKRSHAHLSYLIVPDLNKDMRRQMQIFRQHLFTHNE